MAFLLFLCIIVLGVVASNSEITNIHHEGEFTIKLGSNANLNNDFKDQHNLKYGGNYDNMENK